MPTTDTTSGKWLRATINGTVLGGVQEWTCNETGDVLDRTTADDNGYGNTDTGVDELEGTVSGLWKIAAGPFPTLSRGLVMTNVYLYANRDSATAVWYMPSAIITRVPTQARVNGQLTYSFEFKSRGSYTRPTA